MRRTIETYRPPKIQVIDNISRSPVDGPYVAAALRRTRCGVLRQRRCALSAKAIRTNSEHTDHR